MTPYPCICLLASDAGCLVHDTLCPGCRLHPDDYDYGRDSDCEDCFRDPTPLTREAVTAGWMPLPVWMNRHDERNPE